MGRVPHSNGFCLVSGARRSGLRIPDAYACQCAFRAFCLCWGACMPAILPRSDWCVVSMAWRLCALLVAAVYRFSTDRDFSRPIRGERLGKRVGCRFCAGDSCAARRTRVSDGRVSCLVARHLLRPCVLRDGLVHRPCEWRVRQRQRPALPGLRVRRRRHMSDVSLGRPVPWRFPCLDSSWVLRRLREQPRCRGVSASALRLALFGLERQFRHNSLRYGVPAGQLPLLSVRS